MRDVSSDPQAVTSAVLTFYFDDVIFPELSSEPWTTQAFALEAYITTANGVINWSDTDDSDKSAHGNNVDDWQSPVVRRWEFLAGEVNDLVPGQAVVGVFSPNEPFPASFGDGELAIFGDIGFAIDVTQMLRSLIVDLNIQHIGFRWISETPGGHWTSMDPVGHLPTLSVDMHAPAPLVFKLQSTDNGPIVPGKDGRPGGRPYHVASNPDDEAIYLTAWDWEDGHAPSGVIWPLLDGFITWDYLHDPNRASERPPARTTDNQSVYWNPLAESYQLVADENEVPEGWDKVYYEKENSPQSMSIGNNGIPVGATHERRLAMRVAVLLINV